MSLHGSVRTVLQARTSRGPAVPQPAPSITLHEPFILERNVAGALLLRGFCKRTEALTPSSPMTLNLRSIVVRLLFCFKASANAWPGRAGRPHECKQGSQEHRALAPSSPMRLSLRSNVVKLLFCFKASASA